MPMSESHLYKGDSPVRVMYFISITESQIKFTGNSQRNGLPDIAILKYYAMTDTEKYME